MKILTFWAIPVMFLWMTSDLALQFKVYGGTEDCADNHTCTYYIFIHVFPPFMFNLVTAVMICIDSSIQNAIGNMKFDFDYEANNEFSKDELLDINEKLQDFTQNAGYGQTMQKSNNQYQFNQQNNQKRREYEESKQ